MMVFARAYLTLCMNSIPPYPQKLFFESNIEKGFYFLQNKRYLNYLKPQQPLLGCYMDCCDHTGVKRLLCLQEWVHHALSSSIAAGMENKMKQEGSIKSKSTTWLASGCSAVKSGDSPIFQQEMLPCGNLDLARSTAVICAWSHMEFLP